MGADGRLKSWGNEVWVTNYRHALAFAPVHFVVLACAAGTVSANPAGRAVYHHTVESWTTEHFSGYRCRPLLSEGRDQPTRQRSQQKRIDLVLRFLRVLLFKPTAQLFDCMEAISYLLCASIVFALSAAALALDSV